MPNSSSIRTISRVLWVFTQDLVELFGQQRVQQAAQNLDLLVFQGTNQNPTAALAHVVLPSAVYAEKEGTFTNFQGRVQRIQAAFNPWAEAKPDLEILRELAGLLQLSVSWVDAPSIFSELASREKAFSGLTYQVIGDEGALLKQ